MSDEERDLDMDSGDDDEIDVGTNEHSTYSAMAGMQNDHRFGNFAILSQINSQFMSEVSPLLTV